MSRRRQFTSEQPEGPPGHRAYAVGDVHGRLDLLEELLAAIEADCKARPKAKVTIVFLGDLIDRGPQSADVVERLRHYRPAFASPLFLMGNHEEVLLRLLDGEAALLDDWLLYGGAECARSYGLDPATLGDAERGDALRHLRGAVPHAHVKFLKSFVDTATFGSYLFVHAGIRPGIPLGGQDRSDLRWIRRPFLDAEDAHEHVVVHGHTISECAEILPNRIGIDTGAYRTGVLTALGIEGEDRWLLQTGAASAREEEWSRVANVA